METFPKLAQPSPAYVNFENGLGRWLLVVVPVVLIGHLLGAFALIAILISSNFNILGWLE